MEAVNQNTTVANPPETRTETGQPDLIIEQRILETKLKNLVLSNQETANVVLRIIEFNGIADTRHCTPKTISEVELQGTNARVTQDRGRRNEAILKVTGEGPLNFRFEIDPGTTGGVYYPLGIGFKLKSAGPCQGKEFDARETFASGAVHIYGTSLFFTDNYDLESYGDLFEYYVIIQCVADGQVGIIDPGIWHVNPGI
jgi:hypothetical protein